MIVYFRTHLREIIIGLAIIATILIDEYNFGFIPDIIENRTIATSVIIVVYLTGKYQLDKAKYAHQMEMEQIKIENDKFKSQIGLIEKVGLIEDEEFRQALAQRFVGNITKGNKPNTKEI